MTTENPPTFGLVLAGGLARRMGGGDKALLKIGRETILDRVLARFEPQCSGILLNANGDPARKPARKDQSEGRLILSRHAPRLCAGAWRFPLRRN